MSFDALTISGLMTIVASIAFMVSVVRRNGDQSNPNR